MLPHSTTYDRVGLKSSPVRDVLRLLAVACERVDEGDVTLDQMRNLGVLVKQLAVWLDARYQAGECSQMALERASAYTFKLVLAYELTMVSESTIH